MQKRYNILTFSDVPIPSYQRPYRGVLFVDFAPKQRLNTVYVASISSPEVFRNADIEVHAEYFDGADFKMNQYNLFYRIASFIKLFFILLKIRFLYSGNIDFVRTGGTYLSLLYFLTQKRGTPYFADFCDFYFELYKEFRMPLARFISPVVFLIEKFIIKKANLLFVDTPAQREFLVEKMGVDKKKCIVAPNGILVENFPFLEKKDRSVMNEYGFSDEDIILFYGGDISEMDGIEFLLKFAKENTKRYSSLRILIIGKGNPEYLKKIKNEILENGLSDVVVLDSFKPYNQLYRYVSIADICSAPFRITTTSNTVECGKIITYLLAGKQVLSTRADGVSGLYKDSIEYFQDGDYKDFSEKLHGLIKNLNSIEDLKRTRRLIGERFEFRKVIEREYFIIDKYFEDPAQDFSRYDYL